MRYKNWHEPVHQVKFVVGSESREDCSLAHMLPKYCLNFWVVQVVQGSPGNGKVSQKTQQWSKFPSNSGGKILSSLGNTTRGPPKLDRHRLGWLPITELLFVSVRSESYIKLKLKSSFPLLCL